MADLLREITQWVATGTGWGIGSKLYGGALPAEEPDEAIVILERGGPPDMYHIDYRVGRFMFQVLARGNTYFTARDDSHAVKACLHELGQQTIGEWEIMSSEAVSAPQFLGFDERGRYEFSTNYEVRALRFP
ncbi:MAG: minor capsid protein [bacterium]